MLSTSNVTMKYKRMHRIIIDIASNVMLVLRLILNISVIIMFMISILYILYKNYKLIPIVIIIIYFILSNSDIYL